MLDRLGICWTMLNISGQCALSISSACEHSAEDSLATCCCTWPTCERGRFIVYHDHPWSPNWMFGAIYNHNNKCEHPLTCLVRLCLAEASGSWRLWVPEASWCISLSPMVSQLSSMICRPQNVILTLLQTGPCDIPVPENGFLSSMQLFTHIHTHILMTTTPTGHHWSPLLFTTIGIYYSSWWTTASNIRWVISTV